MCIFIYILYFLNNKNFVLVETNFSFLDTYKQKTRYYYLVYFLKTLSVNFVASNFENAHTYRKQSLLDYL